MASFINPTDIDVTYPIAGQDNDTQGFRDNFRNIKNNFTVAASEITSLQTGLSNVPVIVTVPKTLTSVGTPGSLSYGNTQLYFCTAPDTWISISSDSANQANVYTNANAAAYLSSGTDVTIAGIHSNIANLVSSISTITQLDQQFVANINVLLADASNVPNIITNTLVNYAGNLGGTLTTAAQPNITAVGTLTNLAVTNVISGSVSGNAGSASKLAFARTINGVPFDGTGNITIAVGSSDAGTLTGNTLSANVTFSNLTSVGTLTNLTVTNAISGSVSGSAQFVTGLTAANVQAVIGSVGANSFPVLNQDTTGTAANATHAVVAQVVTGLTAANVQVVIGGVGTSSFPVLNQNTTGSAGSVAAANLTGATLSVNVTASSLTSVGTLTAGAIGSGFTAIPNSALANNSITINGVVGSLGSSITVPGSPNSVAANLTGSTLSSNVTASSLTSVGTLTNLAVINPISGSVTGSAATVTGATQSNITAVGTLTGLTVSGNIVPNANASINLGSVTQWFNTLYGVSTQAQYADLAENYTSDADYEPGTVVIFGGSAEITTTTLYADVRVAGVISANPAYLMNSAAAGLPVALRGRVHVKVMGPVKKGDLLVSSAVPGVAVSAGTDQSQPLAVFAKSLNNKSDLAQGLIEAVII